MDGDKENSKGGHPSKLSPSDRQSIIHQITTGKLDNAVQATHFINNILPNPVTPQTVRNALKEDDFHSIVKQKHPLQKRSTDKTILNLPNIMKIGQWRIGRGSYGQMRPKSTELDQMEGLILGKRRENHCLTEPPLPQSNMEEETTLWYGVVWGGME